MNDTNTNNHNNNNNKRTKNRRKKLKLGAEITVFGKTFVEGGDCRNMIEGFDSECMSLIILPAMRPDPLRFSTPKPCLEPTMSVITCLTYKTL
jgi:hypothetical protein